MVFLLKLIILEMFLGYHHLRKHPYINQLSQNDEMFDVLLSLSLCVLLVGKLNCCLLQVVQQVLLASWIEAAAHDRLLQYTPAALRSSTSGRSGGVPRGPALWPVSKCVFKVPWEN